MAFGRMASRFRRDEQGATATIFAMTLVPLMLTLGVATDYAQMAMYRTRMQAGVDAAAIAMAKEPASRTDGQLKTRGEPFYRRSAPDQGGFATTSFTAARSGKMIQAQAAGTVQLNFGGLWGMGAADISVRSEATAGAKNVEIALVLDNTGSMGQASKLVELKKAVINLLDKMQAINESAPGTVKISLVPFTTQVKVGKAQVNAPWLRFNKDGSAPSAEQKAEWLGCVTDRDQPQNVSDTSPLGSYAQQHQVVDNPKWNNWPRAINWAGWAQWCNDLQPVMPLTADLKSTGAGSLRDAVGGMKANGNTNVSIGVAWGVKALMNRAPFAGAAAAGDADVVKAMIVLTDGVNTEDRWSSLEFQIDDRTRSTCVMARDAVKNANGAAPADSYIRIYTIRVIEGNTTLLKNCAANGGSYSEVNQASELNAVFQGIADQITRIRLTS